MLSTPQRFYRPELDALRFCAFLSVFFFHGMEFYIPDVFRHMEIYHLAWLGQWGVPLFFLLSAFLIVELLLRERDALGRIHLRDFYVRRALRIWPLYFFAFWSMALLQLFTPRINPGVATTWPFFTFFLANWYIVHHGWIAAPVDPLWSISVEEQFYLFIPVLTAFGGRRALRIVSVLVIAVSYWSIYRYARVTWTHDNGMWTDSLVQFQFFAGGALLAMTLNGRVPRWRWPTRLAVFTLALACWISAQVVFGVRGWEEFSTVPQAFAGWPLILAGAALFLLAFLGIAAEHIPRPIRYLGRISFGLYVWHSLVLVLLFRFVGPWLWHGPEDDFAIHQGLVWLLVALALALSIAVAHLSYRLLERPFLQLKQRFTLIPSRPE